MSGHLRVTGAGPSSVSMRQRADGRWRVRWREHGRARERTFGTECRADAKRFVAELQSVGSRVAVPGGAAVVPDVPLTWGEVHSRWHSAKRRDWTSATAEQNEQLLKKWAVPWLADLPITEVTLEHYQHLFAAMTEQGREGSRPRVRSLLAQVEQWAADNNMRPPRRFPVRGLRAVARTTVQGTKPEFVPPRMRPDTARVAVLRKKMVEAGKHGEWWRALHTDVAAYSGLRLGETFALRSCHIDVKERRVAVMHQYVTEPGVQARLKPPKNGKVRTAILLPAMVDDMADRLAEVRDEDVSPPCEDCSDPGCGLLFPAPFGGPDNRSSFGKKARVAFELTWSHDDPSARWPRTPSGGWLWSWRDLRHHAAVVLLDRYRLAPAEAAVLLGHSEQVLLARYYGPTEGAIERALRATE